MDQSGQSGPGASPSCFDLKAIRKTVEYGIGKLEGFDEGYQKASAELMAKFKGIFKEMEAET